MKKNKLFIKSFGLIALFAMVVLPLTSMAQTNFVVTTVSDTSVSGNPVPGQLRWAMQQANLTNGSSLITFNIAGTAPFIINLTSNLPVIINRTVNIDGTSQPGYDINDPATPVILINGGGTLSQGLSFSFANNSKVAGIYIRNFTNGLELNHSDYCDITNNMINQVSGTCLKMMQSNFCAIKGNYINTNKTLSQLGINASEGVFLHASNDNVIGGNNCGEGNTIGFITTEGIDNSSLPGQRNRVSGNRIFGCTIKEIFLLSATATPVIIQTGCTTTGTAVPLSTVEVFGSPGPSGSNKNAKVYMGMTKADASGNWSLPLSNITYPYVTASATTAVNNTSELAIVQAIDLDTMNLQIIPPTRTCITEKLTFEKSGATCWGGVDLVWDFGDGSPPSSSPSHIYTTTGIYFIKLTAYEKNNCEPKTVSVGAYVRVCAEFDCANIPCSLDAIATGPIEGGFGPEGPRMYFYVTPLGGTPPYTYQWFDSSDNLRPLLNATTSTVQTAHTGGAEFKIFVKVTDKNGCTVTKELPEPPPLLRKKN